MNALNNTIWLKFYKNKLFLVLVVLIIIHLSICFILHSTNRHIVNEILSKLKTEENIILKIGLPAKIIGKGNSYCIDGYDCPKKKEHNKVFVYWPGNVTKSLRDDIFYFDAHIFFIFFDKNGEVEDFYVGGS